MAKAATTKTKPGKSAKKNRKKEQAAGAPVAKPAKGAKGAKKGKASPSGAKRHSALESLARLADHPMVADLLAAGAVAAVAAIAEQQLAPGSQPSSKMVKSAGKAAANAIGKKLMGEFGAIASAAGDAAKKA